MGKTLGQILMDEGSTNRVTGVDEKGTGRCAADGCEESGNVDGIGKIVPGRG